jgi:hypothetical protein
MVTRTTRAPAPLSSLALLCLLPFCVAWQGGALGTVMVGGHSAMPPGEAELDGVVRVDSAIRGVFTVDQPGDFGGVLDWSVPASMADELITLPHPSVILRYTAYSKTGERVFSSRMANRGEVVVETGADGFVFLLSAELQDRHSIESVLYLVNLRAQATDVRPGPSDHAPYRPSSGYHDDSPDLYVEVHGSTSSGCDADDWEDDGWADDSSDYDSAGCEGDDWDDGSSDYDGGGCAGDDVGTSSSGCAGDDVGGGAAMEGCEGDAIAASHGRTRRSPTIVRLLNLTPWLMAFAAIGVLRRRPF